MKSLAAAVLALGLVLTACVSPRDSLSDDNALLQQFKQADMSDRRALADGVIIALRKRMGMHASDLTQQIGNPDITGNGTGIEARDDVKYTVYHKGNGWEYFPITIRDWKVVWIGDVESVIQM